MVFRFFFGSTGDEKKQTNVRLTPSIRGIIMDYLGNKVIPPLPTNAQKAFMVATNPNSDLKDLQEVIEADEAFSARIIKISNSVYFDRGSKARTVPEALVIIGLSEAKTFLSSSYMSEFFSNTHGLRALLWHHNISVGIIAKWLNSILNVAEPDFIFLAGLMHDIGKLVLHIRLGSDYEKIIERASRSGFVEAETSLFPFDHTDVGLLLAEEWNFTEDLKKAIKLHHDKVNQYSAEWLIKVADLTAHALGIAHPRGFYKFQTLAKEKLSEFDFIRSKFESLSNYLHKAEENYTNMYDLYAC